jgi:hypothetical protein
MRVGISRWRGVTWAVGALLLLGGCNNEPIRPVGVAPGPQQVPQFPGQQPPLFQPQFPPWQQQPQFTPFLPIDCYMNQHPVLYQYWQTMWLDWQNYAYHYGYSEFDFNTFWYEYCPQVWLGTEYQEIYWYLDRYFYYWVSPQTRWSPLGYDPGTFWGAYQNFPMQPWGFF